MMRKKNITMKQVKERSGLSSRQIRYYDKMGLVFPERTKGKHRLFSEDDLQRLNKIKILIKEGHTIEEIKDLLKTPEPVKKENDEFLEKYQGKSRYEGSKLKSLYPVSNREHLNKVLSKKNKNGGN